MRLFITLTFALTPLGLLLSGCTDGPATGGTETASTTETHNDHGHDHDDDHGSHDDHDHAHPDEGPHHGELIELGEEQYHAELLHDESSVTIYVLDGSAKEQVPIEASRITINATADGRPQQFTLSASPDTNDPEGTSSRFVSEQTELTALLEAAGTDAQLVLTIEGKSYRGRITHNHDHDHE